MKLASRRSHKRPCRWPEGDFLHRLTGTRLISIEQCQSGSKWRRYNYMSAAEMQPRPGGRIGTNRICGLRQSSPAEREVLGELIFDGKHHSLLVRACQLTHFKDVRKRRWRVYGRRKGERCPDSFSLVRIISSATQHAWPAWRAILRRMLRVRCWRRAG